MIDRYNISTCIVHDYADSWSEWEKEKGAGGIFVLAEDHDRVVAELMALLAEVAHYVEHSDECGERQCYAGALQVCVCGAQGLQDRIKAAVKP